MDNRFFKIKSRGRKSFDLAMEVAFTNEYGSHKATHYSDYSPHGLVFYWSEEPGAIKLPVALDWKGAAELAWTWLYAKEDKDYIDYLDHDGSDGKGFQVQNGPWNKVEGTNYGMVSILPCWMWYGK